MRKAKVVKAAVRVFLLSPFLFLLTDFARPLASPLLGHSVTVVFATHGEYPLPCLFTPKTNQKGNRERPPLSQIQRETWQSPQPAQVKLILKSIFLKVKNQGTKHTGTHAENLISV